MEKGGGKDKSLNKGSILSFPFPADADDAWACTTSCV